MDIEKDILALELQEKESKYGGVYAKYLLINSIYDREVKKGIVQHIQNAGYKNIAIYGAGVLGKALFDALKSTFKHITIIDQNVSTKLDFEEATLQQPGLIVDSAIDCVIVTPIHAYRQIAKNLSDHGYGNIISLTDLVMLTGEELQLL